MISASVFGVINMILLIVLPIAIQMLITAIGFLVQNPVAAVMIVRLIAIRMIVRGKLLIARTILQIVIVFLVQKIVVVMIVRLITIRISAKIRTVRMIQEIAIV